MSRNRRTARTGRGALLLLLLTFALAWAAEAAACPVCFGETDDPVVDGVRWSVIFLGGLVYLVLGGGVAMFIVLRRRAQRLQDPHRGLRLVEEPG